MHKKHSKPTQQNIAAKIGISQAQLSRFISGKSRGKKSAYKIAEFIDSEWPDLFIMDSVTIMEKIETAWKEDP